MLRRKIFLLEPAGFHPGAPHHRYSLAQLNKAEGKGVLAINELIYAELSSQFGLQEELDRFLRVRFLHDFDSPLQETRLGR